MACYKFEIRISKLETSSKFECSNKQPAGYGFAQFVIVSNFSAGGGCDWGAGFRYSDFTVNRNHSPARAALTFQRVKSPLCGCWRPRERGQRGVSQRVLRTPPMQTLRGYNASPQELNLSSIIPTFQ